MLKPWRSEADAFRTLIYFVIVVAVKVAKMRREEAMKQSGQFPPGTTSPPQQGWGPQPGSAPQAGYVPPPGPGAFPQQPGHMQYPATGGQPMPQQPGHTRPYPQGQYASGQQAPGGPPPGPPGG